MSGRARLGGWGRTPVSSAEVIDADRHTALAVVRGPDPGRGTIARGLGRAYGDAALNGGGQVLRLVSAAVDVVPDPDTGRITVDAGLSLDALMRSCVPRGWFVPVTPGTRQVTVGGAVAAHVHGKNHHVDGSFGAHVRSFRLLVADGRVLDVTPASDPDLWWATIGGMGLTGVLVDVTLDLLPIETSRLLVDTERHQDLDALLAAMDEGDHRYRYSVAWIDLAATGRSLGRSVLTRGDHATAEDVTATVEESQRRAFAPRRLATVPPLLPNVLTPLGVRAFNEWWFRRAPRRRVAEVQSIARFFHPLDAVADWNRLYGPRGFVQYQFVVPPDRTDTMRRVVERIVSSGHASFLAVLKRFGPGDAAMLGFPCEGWTLALDLPAGSPGLDRLLRTLDALVLEAGGRHYLAKDATATPETIRAGYPELDRWLDVRRRIDPEGRFVSDLARRLELV